MYFLGFQTTGPQTISLYIGLTIYLLRSTSCDAFERQRCLMSPQGPAHPVLLQHCVTVDGLAAMAAMMSSLTKNICDMKNLDEIRRDICQFMDKKGACHNSTLLLKTVGRLAPFQFKGKGYLSCDPFHVITGSHWLSCRVGNSRLSARGLKTQSHCPLAASCISIWISFQRKRPKETSIVISLGSRKTLTLQKNKYDLWS